jgi:hypothetical protein
MTKVGAKKEKRRKKKVGDEPKKMKHILKF